MDIKNLLAESKARFNHNSAKAYLAEKYQSKLIVAEQGGLWKANAETILLLDSFTSANLVLIDTFNSPVKVDRQQLLEKLQQIYETTMEQWYTEWQLLESKR
jgi:selenocysteine-specific translation elongation factor